MPEEVYRRLMLRTYCQLFAALRDGKETIGEP